MQFVRYLVNGMVATLVHFAVLTLNLHVLHLESAGLANFIAAIFGASWSFFGSRYLVFRAEKGSTARQALMFCTLYALIAMMHGAILYLWTDLAGWDYRIGFVLATCIQMLISYFGNRSWVFKV